MPITLKDKMKELSPAQRKKVEARAAESIAEEMTLRELRHARKRSQVKMAKTLGVTQDSISRLEKHSDLLLSTLRKTVEAMGGNLAGRRVSRPRPVGLSGIALQSGQRARLDPNASARPVRRCDQPLPPGRPRLQKRAYPGACRNAGIALSWEADRRDGDRP